MKLENSIECQDAEIWIAFQVFQQKRQIQNAQVEGQQLDFQYVFSWALGFWLSYAKTHDV